jgi:hypothetical protein
LPNETLSPSWDLHQAIHRELTNLPNVSIHYIKAHQDRTTSNDEISQEAKLNIEADKLAEEAYSRSTFSNHVPLIPGVSAQLLIDGKTIVSKHRVIARDIRRTKAIKLQIQEQTGMTDQALPVSNTARRMIIFFSVVIPVVRDGNHNLKQH